MTQLTLFEDADDSVPASVPPESMARATDPPTSLAAAREVTASGAAEAQRALVLATVRKFPGLTSDEIADAAGMERHQPARRCPECERLGLIRRGPARSSRLTGRMGVTWFPEAVAGSEGAAA